MKLTIAIIVILLLIFFFCGDQLEAFGLLLPDKFRNKYFRSQIRLQDRQDVIAVLDSQEATP